MNRRHFLKSLLAIPGLAAILPKLPEAKRPNYAKWDALGNSWKSENGKDWIQITQSPKSDLY